MTGAIRILGAKGVAYKRLREDAQWPPRFTKLLLSLSGGKELALTDPRRFGKVLLRESPEEQPPLSLLAPDPVTDALPLREFVAGLRSARAPVKALLLSQDKLVCGVGNWVADEVLFHAAVHPATSACALTDAEARAVHAAVLRICRIACSVSADHTRFPKGWLFHHRWGKGRDSAGQVRGGRGAD
ncbi:unnamed protein product, partial [Prorocentrum cordatum]